MVDLQTYRDLLDYQPETGTFTWKVRDRKHFTRENQWLNWNARYPGTQAGSVGRNGYRSISVLNHLYKAHRLAWFFIHGVWPKNQIDHINGDRDDNRASNLRDVSNVENARNLCVAGRGASGRIGVSSYNYSGIPYWVARIRVNSRIIHLGYFVELEDAIAAREQAEKEHGFRTYVKSKAVIQSRGFASTRQEARR